MALPFGLRDTSSCLQTTWRYGFCKRSITIRTRVIINLFHIRLKEKIDMKERKKSNYSNPNKRYYLKIASLIKPWVYNQTWIQKPAITIGGSTKEEEENNL